MKNMLTLGINNLEINWSKYDKFENFRDLFQPEDWKDIKYYYNENVTKIKKGYSRNLSLVKPRLDLLGYTLQRIKDTYDNKYNEYYNVMGEHAEKILTFDEYYDIFSNINLSMVNTLNECDYWFSGAFASQCIFEDKEIKRLFRKYSNVCNGVFYESLPPRLLIRILCENPTAKNMPLQWYIFDNIENGWSKKEDLAPQLEDKDKILIITEGKTDNYILQTSIFTLFPAIADFFYFIDMKENYPFTGTGNLYNFTSGLTKIKVQNKAIIIFDNDEAGLFSYKKCKEKLKSVPNLKFYHQPDMPEFNEFLTTGPNGDAYENINGKAVSIECFLDLYFNTDREPKVRWTMYNEKSDQYQGALIGKDDYTRTYKKSLCNDNYNKNKLVFLVNDILDFWCNNKKTLSINNIQLNNI